MLWNTVFAAAHTQVWCPKCTLFKVLLLFSSGLYLTDLQAKGWEAPFFLNFKTKSSTVVADHVLIQIQTYYLVRVNTHAQLIASFVPFRQIVMRWLRGFLTRSQGDKGSSWPGNHSVSPGKEEQRQRDAQESHKLHKIQSVVQMSHLSHELEDTMKHQRRL